MKARKSPSLTDRRQEATVSSGTELAEQIRSGERGRSRDASQPPTPSHLFHQEKTTVEAGTQIEDNFQGILGETSRPFGTRSEIEEILPDKPETILGCERGEEDNPRRGCGIRLTGQIAPMNLLQLSASASNALTDNPPPATEAKPCQEDFFPVPFRLSPEQPEPPEANLPLRPCWVEEEEGAIKACC